MFKRKVKESTRLDMLIDEATKNQEWDLVVELEMEKASLSSKGWRQGFVFGYGSAFTGAILGKLVVDYIIKSR